LDKVSLSGVGAAAFFSSTWGCTLPLLLRSASASELAGALAARRRRYSLKSRLWAEMIWRASSAEVT